MRGAERQRCAKKSPSEGEAADHSTCACSRVMCGERQAQRSRVIFFLEFYHQPQQDDVSRIRLAIQKLGV